MTAFTIVASLLYIAVLVTAFVLANAIRPQTYRRLVLAVKWQRIALTLSVVTLLVQFAAGGWVDRALWLFNTACASVVLWSLCQLRDIKGELMVDEALEQIDDWRWRR